MASDRPEVFAAGALRWPDNGVMLRMQHDRAQPIARVMPEVRGDEVWIDARVAKCGRTLPGGCACGCDR